MKIFKTLMDRAKFDMNFYETEINNLIEKDNFRHIHDIEYKEGKYLYDSKGRKMLNFSSNDYLNLSTDKELINEFISKYSNSPEFLFSSASARLLTGTSSIYNRLEKNLAQMRNKEAALLFNTGYQCNLGTVSALCSRGDVIFSDKLNHASIIAGMQLSGAEFFRYKHLDYENLEELLKKHRAKYKKALIISESVFSMDGDTADIKKLIELKKRYDCMLMTDEAHAFCVFGSKPAGMFENETDIDVITGTLGKAIASMGAFTAASKTIIDYLINKAGSFIFSTALPSVNVLWTNFLLEEKIGLIKEKSLKLNKLITAANEYAHTGGKTQIIPVVIGENAKTVKIADYLQNKGFYVLPLKPPTVPQGTSRLRLSLTADITIEEFKMLINTVNEAKNAV